MAQVRAPMPPSRRAKQFGMFDALKGLKEALAAKPSGKLLAFRATLRGGTVIRKGLPLHEFSSELRLSKNKRMNLHTLVFRADSPEITVTFDDWGATGKYPGDKDQELLLNFIKVTPYFCGE